ATARDRAVRPVACELYFLPVETRVPLKFGRETLTTVTCARVRMTVRNSHGRRAEGWGETPLNVQWVWPSELAYEERLAALKTLCVELTRAWARFDSFGHPLEIGHDFQRDVLFPLRKPPPLAAQDAATGRGFMKMPHLAALVCCSAFDIALHD